ncbi:hypothetical protein [Iningainema tapete]|uniref:hypothetical protein n=1 Tax=Iningainema tapete TaxID=2806730 RepID=UPI001EE2E91F|nr:hypothetical protein [Iningainema tapete]
MVSILSKNLSNERSTQEIKEELVELVKGRDTEPLKAKISFYKDELQPYFEELNRRNH